MPIEFVCRDCGSNVIRFAGEADPVLCAPCEWVSQWVPWEHQAAARERLGIELRERDEDTPWYPRAAS